MNVTVLTFGVTVVAGGVGLLVWGKKRRQAEEATQDRTIADLEQVEGGERVTIRGTVSCDDPVVDPISGEPCAYYRLSAYEVRTRDEDDGRHSTYLSLLEQKAERAPRWYFEDGTGALAVDTEDAAVRVVESASGEALRYLDIEHSDFGVRLLEGKQGCIWLGSEAFVEGHGEHGADGLALTGPELILSTRPTGEHRWSASVLVFAAVALFLLGGLFALFGVVAREDAPPEIRSGPLQRAPAQGIERESSW